MSRKVLESLRTPKVCKCNFHWYPVSRKSYVFLEFDKQNKIPNEHFIRSFRFSMLSLHRVQLRKWLIYVTCLISLTSPNFSKKNMLITLSTIGYSWYRLSGSECYGMILSKPDQLERSAFCKTFISLTGSALFTAKGDEMTIGIKRSFFQNSFQHSKWSMSHLVASMWTFWKKYIRSWSQKELVLISGSKSMLRGLIKLY